jgi:ligand-binding sensor domain-containing protein/AraC-like DNA-binding protein
MGKLLNMGSTPQVLVGIIILMLFYSPSWGLNPDKTIDQYLVDHWDTTNGIPSNMIHSIAQTPDGYLWIATNKGLVRFDGMKFSIVLFAPNEEKKSGQTAIPQALYLDKDEKLWIGSNIGLTLFDYKTRQFNTFTTADGLTSDTIRRIAKDVKGNLWIGFISSYVNRFSNNIFTPFNDSHGLASQKITAIIEDQKGNLLFGTRNNGIFEYKDGKFIPHPLTGLKGYIVNMHEDHKGRLWVCTSKGLLRKTDKTIETYTLKHGLSSDLTTNILEDSQKNLWVGTENGLNRIKKETVGRITFEHTLKSLVIICLFEDQEGSLWAGTYNAGLFRLKDAKFKSYAPIEAFPEEVLFSMYRDRKGDIWIGTTSGKLIRFRDHKHIESIPVQGVSGTGISAIAEDTEGNLWLGTNGCGVFQKKSNTDVHYTKQDGLADNLVTSIFRDTRGNLWFSTFDGVSVFRYPRGGIESFKFKDGLSGKVVHNISEDKAGNIWIATDKGITVLKDGKTTKPDIKYYLGGITVTWIYQDPILAGRDENVFWLATHGAGLKRLNIKDGSVKSVTVSHGMITNFVNRFFKDKQGYFWFMSDSGILRINKSDLDRYAVGKADRIDCVSFGRSEGLKSPEFSNPFPRHSALETKAGELWFLAKNSIYIINPDNIRINKVPPPVVIEKAFFDGKSLYPHQDEHMCKGVKYFQFYFTALTLLSPEKVKFQYRLEGFEKKWIFLPPDRNRVAHYWNLDPGTYTFKVIACNADGVWNQTGDSITFTLKPFFYQTLLFKIAFPLLLAALIAVAVYIYKKRPFEKKEKYKGSSLNPLFVEECIKKLKHLMEDQKVYSDEKISLASLAEKLSTAVKSPVGSHQLSQMLNEKLNRNFPDFINYYRVEEAKEILKSPRGEKLKIIFVAQEVGFQSMTAFYKAFKKYTNMTPNQYKEEVKKKKSRG